MPSLDASVRQLHGGRHAAGGFRSAEEPDQHSSSGAAEQPHSRGEQGSAGGGSPSRLHHFFERTADAHPNSTALECQGEALTYGDLDIRANRLANYLLTHKLEPGARVGILLERSVDLYVALLGVQKAGATFVPIDPAAPADRVAYIASDSGLDLILATSSLEKATVDTAAPVLLLDDAVEQIAAFPPGRPVLDRSGDPLCYIIYTSGSTGRPKGVEIEQSSICNFINVVPRIYGVTPSERVYQGMTISFDFSIEEIWPTWAMGATLVAGPTDSRRVGSGLADFLEESAITMIYCVPTVLATLDRLIPSIRTVNVGGEACPQELVERWGPGRRILNTYGPTEATVTCIYAELTPGRPVTIGKPLPTYTAVLLDEHLRPVPDGEVGEICVGGLGVARGYVNRPDLTADRFIPDPTGQTEGRIYRTGDLGRYTSDGEIEYRGRADSEVKVRGHRVDLQEIESVLLEDEAVSAAVVTLLDTPGTGGELAAYLLLTDPGDNSVRGRLYAAMRRRLPPYMVTSYLEVLDTIPMLPSGKADRKTLPAPILGRLIGGHGTEHVAPTTPTEQQLTSVFAETLKVAGDQISINANLFDDLGGHSLIAATLVSTLRRADIPGAAELSILDLYANPSIAELADFFERAALERQLLGDDIASEVTSSPEAPPSWWRIVSLGLGQFSWIYLLIFASMLPLGLVYGLNQGEASWTMLGQLALTLPVTYLAGRWLVPLATARLLGRGIRPGTYPLYGGMHLRVWLIQRAMTTSPLARLAGSPWAETYLRLAGARIGKHCHIGTAQILLPSLVRLGDNATVGYAVDLDAYDFADGVLRLGLVDIGDDAVVGANSVLQGPCSLGDRATLGVQSLVSAGQQVPADENWAGSPATARGGRGNPVVDLMTECARAPRTWPRELLPRFAVSILALELLPMLAMLPVILTVWIVLLEVGQTLALVVTIATGPLFVLSACSLILLFRRFALVRTPVGIHHLRSQLGLEKWFGDKLLELSLELTNSLYGTLYTAIWLRLLGAKVGRGSEIATIANIDPDLLTLEDGCFIADMASVGAATYANGHVAFQRTEVGRRAFVGNASLIPSGTHLGDGSLIGVGSVPPITGVKAGTSWLGSPSIFLPVREMYDEFTEETTFRPSRRKVAARYVIEFVRATLPASLLALSTFGTLFVLSLLATRIPLWTMLAVTPAVALAFSLLTVLVVAAIKWLVVGRYRTQVKPLWSGFVRRTEFVTGVFEGAAVPALLDALTGTPMLAPLMRLFGTRVGRRVLLCTTYLTEFDLVHIGDDVVVGPKVSLQTHLFEDRVMKMGEIDLEPGVTLGCRAVVLYGTTLERRSHLAPLSLVMKGESLPSATRWAGIPARIAVRYDSPPTPELVTASAIKNGGQHR